MRVLYFLVFLALLSLVVDVGAWKFWKKKDELTSTTPKSSSQELMEPPSHTNKGIAAAVNPALAIGVGNLGPKSGESPRNQPRKPNPGTEVAIDSGPPKAATGTNYKNWAAEFGGIEAGTIKDKSKMQEQKTITKPDNPHHGTGSSSIFPPISLISRYDGKNLMGKIGNKAATSQTTASTRAPSSVPTPIARPSIPASQPKSKPETPQSKAGSAVDSKNWNGVADGGNRVELPIPGLRAQTPSPTTPGQHPSAFFSLVHPQPGNAGQSGRPSISTGAAIGAAGIGGAALAGAAATSNSGKVFSSNPTYSKGNAITDEDLQKLSEALFIKDVNNANKYITLNLQKTTTGSNSKDEAVQPLLQVKPEALQLPTIRKVLDIYDNYKLDTRENEYISPAQRQEESLLVDTFLSTNLMSAAMRFLADKGFIKKDYYEYKDTLRTLWFNLYSRGEGKIGSSGFEHVFLTELKLGTEVSGLHNWIYFNAEELKKRLNYLGYIKKVDLGNKAAIVKAHVTFDGIDKPVTDIFVGTSPELEMALYTVCFFARSEKPCPVSLGGTKFNIITHKFRYRGRDLIGSAYPSI
ncbi:PREDICTED: poly(U)-specific endoribonuclease homolog [Ceratosolen solmsi marchali]|uniref:Poly(U)-specific endoribonuclease homolog n=1 Tax=Ceratosolen solmsi marchali TaxID=326594 RepID=A0AAJ6YIX9_9HYME|nr:PREDICTED: poly(U)-specific endoribonuclease homolog [Ceratosolen solmsi marchali]